MLQLAKDHYAIATALCLVVWTLGGQGLAALFKRWNMPKAATFFLMISTFGGHAFHLVIAEISLPSIATPKERAALVLDEMDQWAQEENVPGATVFSARIRAAIDLPRPKVAPASIVVTCLALFLVGCGGSEPPAKVVTDTMQAIGDVDPALRGVYESSQRLCLSKPSAEQDKCIADVRESWKPIIDLLQRIRSGWCTLQPEACVK
jgi:hypothetical protein